MAQDCEWKLLHWEHHKNRDHYDNNAALPVTIEDKTAEWTPRVVRKHTNIDFAHPKC